MTEFESGPLGRVGILCTCWLAYNTSVSLYRPAADDCRSELDNS